LVSKFFMIPMFLCDDFVKNHGVLLLLFETLSGFAIFGVLGIYLYKSAAIERVWANFVHYDRAKEIVWLLEFQTFDDKSSAISVGTSINKQLTEMIMKRRNPGQTLVVGKQEYKSIIESSLHHMHRLVPMEKSELPKEDRVPMSQGLQMLLSRHGFHVKPKMVSLPVAIAFPLVLADALGILHFQTRALSAIFFLFPFAFFFGDEAALFVSR